MQRRLERSATNRVVTGVCGGIAEHLQVDPTLVRVFFVIATVLTAFAFVVVYIALLVLMPLPGGHAPIDDFIPGATSTTPPAGPADPNAPPRPPLLWNGQDAEGRRNAFGYVLVALGIVFLLGNVGLFRFVQWQIVWPLVLIAIGGLLLLSRSRK